MNCLLRNTTRRLSSYKTRNTKTTELVFQKAQNFNEQYTNILSEVGEYYKLSGNSVKHKGYERAVKTLSSLPYKITSLEEALNTSSIGKGIADKIVTILETNSLPQLEEMKKDTDLQKIKLFSRIHGVGPSQAKKWVNNGLQSLSDLQGVKLTKYQALGLKYLDEFEQRIPREEIAVIESILKKSIHSLDNTIIFQICGSYRRGLATSGDVDVLLTHPLYTIDCKNQSELLKQVVTSLEDFGLVTDRISLGKTKFMGVVQLSKELAPQLPEQEFLHRRIDIRFVPIENFWCGLLYFTGSGYFNTQMR